MSVVNAMELAPMRELSLDEIDAVSGGDNKVAAFYGEVAVGFIVGGAIALGAAPIAVGAGLYIAGFGLSSLGVASGAFGAGLFKLALDEININ